MGQTVTLGGDRIGSGPKMKEYLHDYEMSSHNLEQDFKSTMAPGVLYPCMRIVATNHDNFDIDIDSMVMTLPTKGPLLGSYKLQVDVYSCPFRLYQGILHNNPVGIGLKMKQVYLPKINFTTKDIVKEGSNKYNRQVSESALIKYNGISGAGRPKTGETVGRKFQCIPELAYYDIFKCYYANKQEEKAYVISVTETQPTYYAIRNQAYNNYNLDDQEIEFDKTALTNYFVLEVSSAQQTGYEMPDWLNLGKNGQFALMAEDGYGTRVIELQHTIAEWQSAGAYTGADGETKTMFMGLGTIPSLPGYIYALDKQAMMNAIVHFGYGEQLEEATGSWYMTFLMGPQNRWAISDGVKDLQLVPFDLENIDTMRNLLLSANTMGTEFVINDQTNLMPYSTLVNKTTDGITFNAYPMNGLVVKTYQSDLFNNWLDSEFVDGDNGISQITAVAVEDGKFLLDSVNFAEKMYNLLNRILVSGGTYQDWQEARWGEGATRMAESPIYVGGMSGEVMFEAVVSSSETGTEGSEDYMPLGSLGGRGKQMSKKGGEHIHVKCEEPGYIIAIASLTPRICYSQGNDWDRTELDTLEDLHAPEMDGIGFQDLLVEQFAWWDTVVNAGYVESRHSAGKQTAWINYQTAVDKCFGDFAKPEGDGFMVLNRNYTMTDDGEVGDITTYIDPAKYNYCFAYDKLDAQNFWVQIHFNIIGRRKMGVQQIPNF